MTVEFYDLAQRALRRPGEQAGLEGGRVAVPGIAAGDLRGGHQDANGAPVATVGTAGGSPVTGKGVRVLRALAAAGARMDTTGEAVQVVIPDGATLAVLAGITRSNATHKDDAVRAASAVVGWWVDRSGYPGTGAVIDLLAHSRQRYITGAVPARERHASFWRAAFGVRDGIAGLIGWAARGSARGEMLAALTTIREDDTYTYLDGRAV